MSKNKEDKSSFKDYFAKYGITENDIHADTLCVGKNQTVFLGVRGKKPSLYAPRMLRARGVDDIKNWIGNANSVLKKNPQTARRFNLEKMPATKILASFDKINQKILKEKNKVLINKLNSDIRSLLAANRKMLHTVSKAYVFGDSGLYVDWRGVLDFFLKDYKFPYWLFRTTIVESNAVLEIEGPFNFLFGGTLIFKEGGTIRTSSGFNINFMNIKKA